ncbi:MAG: hypothetical protein R3C04_12070, partial [Hyphomonas sp.]
SAVVRNVPTGPFLLVNMAFGVSRAGFWPYLAGMAVGALPKIILVAFAGRGLMAALQGNMVTAIVLSLASVGIYVGVAWWMRRRDRSRRQSVALIGEDPVDNSDGSTD